MSAKIARSAKPTVFLSHSSSNRRELLALKHFLAERSGGMIEFFLSSDDVSIAHGTIWPAEVRDALARMKLMFVFISAEALKSGWTYFEAGYGLRHTGTANIYCLPGTERGSLPSPFNILQARNLHSAREVALLIAQINERLAAALDVNVTKQDFDRIFKKPSLGLVETGPKLEKLVESIRATLEGPAESANLFAAACKKLKHPVSTATAPDHEHQDWCSTGVRISIEKIYRERLAHEIKITAELSSKGTVEVEKRDPGWVICDYPWVHGTIWSIADVESYNARVPAINEPIRKANAERDRGPRRCEFTIFPLELGTPTRIVDAFLDAAPSATPPEVEIRLLAGVRCETRGEAIGARIQGSPLTLLPDGKLLWKDRATVTIVTQDDRRQAPHLTLSPLKDRPLRFGDFQVEELICELFELQLIALPPRNPSRRKCPV